MITEYALIASVFRKPSILQTIELTDKDFANSTCAMIWDSLKTVSQDYPIDVVTISDDLSKKTGQDWLKIVAGIANTSCSVESVPGYQKNIKECARERAVRDLLASYLQSDEGVNIDRLTSELMDLSTRGDTYRILSLQECVKSAFDEIEHCYNNKGSMGISTGFNSLDEKLGGLHNSDLIVVGGRPAMGKTAFAISMMIKSNCKSFFVSGEMAKQQIGKRFISQLSRVPAVSLRNGNIEEEQWPMLTAGMQESMSRKAWVIDKPNPSIEDVMRYARIARHEKGAEVIYCDYLQKFTDSKSNFRTEEVGHAAKCLKQLARELDCPVVALAQLNRNLERREDKHPIMSDLEGAGAIEQEADSIGFLYRDVVYNENADPTEAQIRWEKNRHGPTGYMNLRWCPKTMTYYDNEVW
jgi:replicative DNA helicase